MSKVRRVDFSSDEWLAGTRELALEERGAYWDVCALMYSRGGPIADDEDWIAKALTCHVRTWRALRFRLIAKGKVFLIDGKLHNARVLREIQRAEGRLKSSREAADASVKSRRERDENTAQSNDYKDIPEATASVSDEAIYQRTTSNSSYESKKDVTAVESVTTGALAENGSPQAKRNPKGERLPEGWRPDDDLRSWTLETIEEASSGISAGQELAKFCDHWRAQPGARGRKTDWPATWRNWIRRAIELEGKGNGAHRIGHAKRGATEEDPIDSGIRESLARRHLLARG
jgi:uncharacterized protein YdaU (DUF1376 family)